MAKSPRPGKPLTVAETLAALLSDTITALEALLPAPGIESILADVRFVHRRLEELSK